MDKQKNQEKVSFKKEAWFKMIFHACKYMNQAVGGLMIGNIKENDYVVYDIVPLFHTPILDPMLEFSLIQVELWANKNSHKILGYYHANEHLKDNKVPPISIQIANKIKQNLGRSILVLLDNQNIGKKQFTANLFEQIQSEKHGAEWVQSESTNVFKFVDSENKEEDIFKMLQTYIKKDHFYNLADFDDHLTNPSFDWRNENLFNVVEN